MAPVAVNRSRVASPAPVVKGPVAPSSENSNRGVQKQVMRTASEKVDVKTEKAVGSRKISEGLFAKAWSMSSFTLGCAALMVHAAAWSIMAAVAATTYHPPLEGVAASQLSVAKESFIEVTKFLKSASYEDTVGWARLLMLEASTMVAAQPPVATAGVITGVVLGMALVVFRRHVRKSA